MSAERILLHICCAPCATTVIRRLQEAGYQVHGYFYNPNIQPEKEYYQRLLEVQRLCKLWQIPLEIGDYDWDRWQAEVHGMENEPEGGERCRVCYRYRLAATAARAKEMEIDIITTTLTISPRKRPEIINPIGREVGAEAEVRFYEADWKKKDGFKQSLDTSRELNLYRQHYCGCKYSLKEREAREARRAALEPAAAVSTSDPAPAANRVTKAMRILAEDPPKQKKVEVEPQPLRETDTRAKWELSPLERKKRHDKKHKPWARE